MGSSLSLSIRRTPFRAGLEILLRPRSPLPRPVSSSPNTPVSLPFPHSVLPLTRGGAGSYQVKSQSRVSTKYYLRLSYRKMLPITHPCQQRRVLLAFSLVFCVLPNFLFTSWKMRRGREGRRGSSVVAIGWIRIVYCACGRIAPWYI